MFCLCKSVIFDLRGADQTNLRIQKREKTKRKRRERKERKTCQIMLCTTNNRGCRRKAGAPLQKLTQEEESEILGGVWSRGELDGSQGVLLCTASSSCLGRDRRQRGLVSGWREREGQRSGPERKGEGKRPGAQDGGTEMVWSMPWLGCLLPSLAAHTSSLPGSGKQGEGGMTSDR